MKICVIGLMIMIACMDLTIFSMDTPKKPGLTPRFKESPTTAASRHNMSESGDHPDQAVTQSPKTTITCIQALLRHKKLMRTRELIEHLRDEPRP
jgi:hypothetical protein